MACVQSWTINMQVPMSNGNMSCKKSIVQIPILVPILSMWSTFWKAKTLRKFAQEAPSSITRTSITRTSTTSTSSCPISTRKILRIRWWHTRFAAPKRRRWKPFNATIRDLAMTGPRLGQRSLLPVKKMVFCSNQQVIYHPWNIAPAK